MPEVPCNLLMKHFVVADCRLQKGVPINEPLSSVDDLFFKKAVKGMAHRPSTNRIECEPCSLPVTTATHLTQLLDDPLLVLFFPGPNSLQ